MKLRFAVFLFAVCVLGGVQARASNVLPDACGSDKVEFDTKNKKLETPPAPPAEGKAQMVFVQTTVKQGGSALFAIHDFTTRLGLDGTWAGAAGNNSYFTVDIAPGVHHFCASVQGDMSATKRMVAADTFTAEAGKTYYFEFFAERITQQKNFYSSHMTMLSEDEGKYREKLLPMSSSTPKHGE